MFLHLAMNPMNMGLLALTPSSRSADLLNIIVRGCAVVLLLFSCLVQQQNKDEHGSPFLLAVAIVEIRFPHHGKS